MSTASATAAQVATPNAMRRAPHCGGREFASAITALSDATKAAIPAGSICSSMFTLPRGANVALGGARKFDQPDVGTIGAVGGAVLELTVTPRAISREAVIELLRFMKWIAAQRFQQSAQGRALLRLIPLAAPRRGRVNGIVRRALEIEGEPAQDRVAMRVIAEEAD